MRPSLVRVFDVIHIKAFDSPAQSLLDSKLEDRKRLLRIIFTEEPGRFEVVPAIKARTEKDIQRELEKVLDSRYVELNPYADDALFNSFLIISLGVIEVRAW